MSHTASSLDDLEDSELPGFCERIKETWQIRDQNILEAKMLYEQRWKVKLPEAFDGIIDTQHTSLAREIPQRVIGTITLADPVFTRPNPSDDWAVGQRGNAVERFFRGKFDRDRRESLAGQDLYRANAAQVVHTGAVCNASLFSPALWSGPLRTGDDGTLLREWWRDGNAVPTEDAGAVDPEASDRAYVKAVERHRQSGVLPFIRRAIPTSQTYPVIVDGGASMQGMVLRREVTRIEAIANGFSLDVDAGRNTGMHVIWEVSTPNRTRFLFDNDPVGHVQSQGSPEGIAHKYGFVPYTYCSTFPGFDFSPDSMGLPMLCLVASQIRNITMIRTLLKAALHVGTFMSYQLVDVGPPNAANALVASQPGTQMQTWDFKSASIMSPPAGKRIELVPGATLTKDFWELEKLEIDEINRLIPRTISGQAESSGFNTSISSAQARSIFAPQYSALERNEEKIAAMDMRHLMDRVDGPVALDVPGKLALGASRPAKYSRVSLSARDLDGYLGITVSIDREPDRITLGQNAARLLQAGIGDKEWAADQAGILDYEDMLARQTRDHVLMSPTLMAVVEDEAIKQFGLEAKVKEAEAAARIQQTAQGPAVSMPGGGVAGPGLAAPVAPPGLEGKTSVVFKSTPTAASLPLGQALGAPALAGPAASPLGPPPTSPLPPGGGPPQMQGNAGAMLGGGNLGAIPGGPNMGASNNPTIAQPAPTPTGRGRSRRRGGAIPGAPQQQPRRTPRQPIT